MWRFHISSRPEIQLFQLRATHKQTKLLNVVHHILERCYISRIENVRIKPAPLSTASSRSKADFLGVVPSADLHPGLRDRMDPFVQTRVAMAPDDFSSNPSPRSSCVPRSTDISTRPGHPSTISRQAMSKALLKSRYTIAVDHFCSIATSLNVRSV